jgi:ABC-2 type transport system permease protein
VSPDVALARRAFRQVRTGAFAWAAVFGVTVASTAVSYATTYPTEAARQQAQAAVSGDTGLAIVLGPTSSITSVGGYTVYKVFVMLTTIGAIWALLATTRLLRGEEDAGRWQLTLSGSTRPGRATGATLTALFVAVAIVFVGLTVCTAAVGQRSDIAFGVGPSVLYGLSVIIAPLVFVGVGALTSQLGATRRQATGLGMAVFAASFLLRMVADSGSGLRWLRWTTPFGWIELVRPFTANDAWPLLPAGLATAALVAGAVVLASRRDAGAGVIAGRDVAQVRPFGLRSTLGLATRLDLGVLAGWFTGVVACAFFLGLFAKVTTSSVPASVSDTLDKFGVRGSFTNQFFAISFLFVVTLLALVPAGQVSAAGEEETSGRLVHVLARPTTRTSWFAGRLALTTGAIVISALGAGVAAWLGARSQGVDAHAGQLIAAAANGIPTALLSLGIGALALALVPRAAAAVVYGVVIWSLVIDLFGSLFSGLHWLERVSLLHYMAQAPAEDPRPLTLAATTAIALACAALATVLFDRRDLRTP